MIMWGTHGVSRQSWPPGAPQGPVEWLQALLVEAGWHADRWAGRSSLSGRGASFKVSQP